MVKQITQEDALKYIIHCLTEEDENLYSDYGYGFYLPSIMRKWVRDNHNVHDNEAPRYLREISPSFYEASWELCRIGVLRPGVYNWGAQSTTDGSAGNGYSITPFGKQWLEETDKDSFIPTEPGRFAEMLSPYSKIFGPGFHERAQQAIRCYGAHAYLACCVMCGAAIESILLHLAITKDGDEDSILKKYASAGGRKKLENIILQQQKASTRNRFQSYFELLKYWRDEAAHGRKSDVSESEAYTSLGLMLRCAMFADDNYDLLT